VSLSVDVVVPTFNGRDLVRQCLEHLRAQTVPHAVIVVDNCSSDDTVPLVRESFPEVRLVELDANLGFSAACNRAAAVATGDVLVLVNNDILPRPDFLECLTRPLGGEAELGSVAALLLQVGGQTIDSIGLTADTTLAGFPRLHGRPAADAGVGRPVLTGPSAGAGAYRREAWDDVGGLDEGVLGYGEDLDLALRLVAAGWKTTAAPGAIAVHLGSASFGRRSAWQRYHGGFARGYFLRRYGILRTKWSARALFTEVLVVAGDALLSRDLSAARGRIAGWRSARGLPTRPLPPSRGVDSTITFWESVRLRRVVSRT